MLKKILQEISKPITFYNKGLKTHKFRNISSDIKIEKPVEIYGKLTVGKNVEIRAFSYAYSGYIGDNTVIGRFCSIADGVIISPEEHPMNRITTSPVSYFSPGFKGYSFKKKNRQVKPRTVIGSDVWIGSNVTILSGVTIGNSVVIGAGSIVTKDIPDFTIAVGIPAKVIKIRNEQKCYVDKYGDWWERDISELHKIEFDIELF